jgi:uncharacterized protein (TIGR00269 family)
MKYVKCGGEVFELKLTPLGTNCRYCKEKEAVIKPAGIPLPLCKECFLTFCEKKVKMAIEKHKMFNPEDKVGVMVSGGKDSAALLAILKKLYPEQRIYAIHLNLGIRYYSDFAEDAVKKLCEKLNVPLIVYNLKEKDGFLIDDFIFTNFKNKICSVCGAIKRYYFSKLARENGINVICTAHHLDDVLSTMISIFFQGDFLGLSRLGPVIVPLFEGQAKKVKPLYYLQEKDVFAYSVISNLPLEGCACPHGEVTPVKEWKKWIEEKDKESPSFKFRVYSIFRKKLLPILKRHFKNMPKEEFLPCENCGEPTPSKSKLCLKCRRVKLLERVKDKKIEFEPDEFLEFLLKNNPQNTVVFDVRIKEDYEKGSFPGAIWIDPNLLGKDDKVFVKTFKPYKKKNLFFMCYTGRTSYRFVLRLRKFGFLAFNISKPKELLLKSKNLNQEIIPPPKTSSPL